MIIQPHPKIINKFGLNILDMLADDFTMAAMPKPETKKRTMTLNLTGAEMEVLQGLAREKGLNKTAVLRQALRLYQELDARIRGGDKIMLEDKLTKAKSELVVL